MSGPKFPHAAAWSVALELLRVLARVGGSPRCERIVIAGSLRRRKREVGDIELVYIPRVIEAPDPSDMFGALTRVNDTDRALEEMIAAGIIERRLNVKGAQTWGPENKLARHCASGIPVDFFSTSAPSWQNYLVCRTGGAESNTRIAATAKSNGWKWCPTSPGFVRGGEDWENSEEQRSMHSEREVFAFVGLDYQEPWQR